MESIPFDPSLVMGNIVSRERILRLFEEAKIKQGPILAKQAVDASAVHCEYLETMVRELTASMPKEDDIANIKFGSSSSKHTSSSSSGLTNTEKSMIGITNAAIEKLKDHCVEARGFQVKKIEEWTEEIMKSSKEMSKLFAKKKEQSQLGCEPTSPIDWEASGLSTKPLSFDTMDFDCKYFRDEKQSNKSSAGSSQIGAWVSSKAEGFGSSVSASVGAQTQRACQEQSDSHTLDGHVVFIVRASHKMATVMSPLNFDPDNSLKAWNQIFPEEKMKAMDMKTLKKAAEEDEEPKKKEKNKAKDGLGVIGQSLPIMTGCTCGSSFIGCLHIRKEEQTSAMQKSSSWKAKVEAEAKANLFIASLEGKIGFSAAFSNAVKELQSSSVLSSNCTIISRGLIPSIKSHEMKTMVQALKPSPKEIMEQVAAIQGSNSDDSGQSGNDARKGAMFTQMSSSHLQDVVSNLSEVADEKNKIIDMNSMMEALDDYIALARESKCGVPINFYLTYLDKASVAKLVLDKYHPQWQTEYKDEEEAGEAGERPKKKKQKKKA